MADAVSPELEAKLNVNATVPMEQSVPVSSKRARAMATINAAILQSQQAPEEQKPITKDTPALDALTGLTPEELRVAKAAELAQEQDKVRGRELLTQKQNAILDAQKKLLGEEEAARLRKEQEQEAAKSQFVKSGEAAIKSARGIVHGADVRLGSLPQPGSIVFPLVLLLLLFFILIQVGGYSRIQWLWLVLSGQAQVGTALMTVTPEGPPENNPSPFNPGGNLTGGAGGSDLFSNLQVRPFLPPNGMYPVNGVY